MLALRVETVTSDDMNATENDNATETLPAGPFEVLAPFHRSGTSWRTVGITNDPAANYRSDTDCLFKHVASAVVYRRDGRIFSRGFMAK